MIPVNESAYRIYSLLLGAKAMEEPFIDPAQIKATFIEEQAPYGPEVERQLLELLDPREYGMDMSHEYPKLEWIADVLAWYGVYREIPIAVLIKLLNAVNYHGLFSLFDVFGEINIHAYPPKDRFAYFKTLAKYYKSSGNLLKAQAYYRSSIETATGIGDKELTAYSLVLLAKLYSDFWQRKGLYLAFNQIAFHRIAEGILAGDSTISRRSQICADSFAKETYATDPELGERIFSELITGQNQLVDTHNRITFRWLECRIAHSIRKRDCVEAGRLMQDFERLTWEIDNNPKALYIRKIQLLGFYRAVRQSFGLECRESDFLKNRLAELLDDEATILLNDAIESARKYNDRKFAALGYYEKSFWARQDIPGSVEASIQCLEESNRFLLHPDETYIVNQIYVKVNERLAGLYSGQLKWTKAITQYSSLISYLSKLTKTLEDDSHLIDGYIDGTIDRKGEYYPEFECLTNEELHGVREKLVTDYRDLTKKLVDFVNKINVAQNSQQDKLGEVMGKHSRLLTHDLNENMTAIGTALDEIKKEPKSNESSAIILLAQKEINRARKSVEDYEKMFLQEIMSPENIDITLEIRKFIASLMENLAEDVTIKLETLESISATMRVYLLNRILDNLIKNAIQVARRNGVEKIRINITLVRKSGYIRLIVADNSGDLPFFREVIDKLNASRRTPSKKHSNGKGNGLSHIYGLLYEEGERPGWELTEAKSGFKELEVPLIKLENYP